jgi:hypothetical protein
MWREDEGVLSFEWILLITLLAIGIVGGLAAVRDAVISELGDVSAGILHLDQSFVFPGNPKFCIPEKCYQDQVPPFAISRGNAGGGQGPVADSK